MLKAIIIDDEIHVCNLILALGHWDDLGIEVVAVCHDGEDGLNSIYKTKPDIIITDIRMPVFSGMDLVRLTKEAEINAQFIIISGYKQFEYVQSAIKMDVADYLLKPICEDELNSTLQKVVDIVLANARHEQENQEYTKLLEVHTRSCQNTLLEDLQEKRFSASDFSGFNQQYQTHFIEGYLQVVLINTSLLDLHQANVSFEKKIREMVFELFNNWSLFLVIPSVRGYFLILNYSCVEVNHIPHAIADLQRHITALADIYGDFDISIGVGTAVESINLLPLSFQSAVSFESAKILLGWGSVIYHLPPALTKHGIEILKSDLLRHLSILLETLDVSGISVWFDQWGIYLNTGPIALSDILDAQDKLIDMLQSADLSAYVINDIRIESYRFKNINAMVLAFRNYFLQAVQSKLAEKDREESRPIRIARQFILQKYSEAITLEIVAAKVGLSPTYFSTVFKQSTGQGFTEYLTDVRINSAKNLLRSSSMNIQEISEAIGFTDSKYFRKLFKKVTGLRPSEYRKLYW